MRNACISVLLASALVGMAVEPSELQPGRPVDYSGLAFQPRTWKEKGTSTMLLPWHGDKIVFLTVQGDYDPKLLARWVGALDSGWKLYGDLTGTQPNLLKHVEGKPTIAAVPDFAFTCGAGCGYVGATGIELAMFYNWNYPALRKNPDSIPHYVFYEMGRNFYTFGDRHSCFTTGFAVFMRYVCMDALGLHDDDRGTREIIEKAESFVKKSNMPFLRTFTNIDGLDEKAPRLKHEDGTWLSPSDQPVTYASAMLRLRRENGGDAWVRRFFKALASCPTAKPSTREGALEQSWNWYVCASIAARKDLSQIFCDEWRMPLTRGTREALAKMDWAAVNLTPAAVTKQARPNWRIESRAGPPL